LILLKAIAFADRRDYKAILKNKDPPKSDHKINMEEKYHLEKQLWTEVDFDFMGWHDSHVYAVSFSSLEKEYEFMLDIDYIFKWVSPLEGETYFKFWIAPCTLIFENVYDLVIDLEISVPSEITIGDIIRKNPKTPKGVDYIEKDVEYDWLIETFNGDISFKSTGYKQYVRQHPKLTENQEIDFENRAGVSFSKEFFE